MLKLTLKGIGRGLNPTSCEKKRPEFFMMDIEGLSLEEVRNEVAGVDYE